ncbi:hypothetical protein [Ramlibacter alkalitolerans]|uniref:PsiF repeat-containing protein n=1 Tax=Ramlibacter alkalitolerans TaxID=2039631 RepID=A0ABS1JQ39_9BURK|nr:hypothetical protein [Ramlibacter alkalitolerans]MBL0426251.1 hypothetical protein [Ramlibacter alkalitolerans]
MRKLLCLVMAAGLAAPAWPAAAPAPAAQRTASDTARAAFLKKCIRDVTKRSCTAPPQARTGK